MRESRRRILLLDDDPEDRALARLVLEHQVPELTVEEITDAAAFAQACGRRSFDLVILERELRWADGLALLAVLKEDWPEVPVILFTGLGNEELALRALRLGVDDYLVKKPASFLRLPMAVRTALDKVRPRSSSQASNTASAPTPPLSSLPDRPQLDRNQLAQLRRANEELLQFASMASHELQAPVRMMERYTQLLKEDYGEKLGPSGDELADIVVSAARRLRSLIEDLLTLSRVEGRERHVETTGAEGLLERALGHLAAAIEESGAEVTHSPLPEIEAEPSLIVQLLQNLVGNAIKFRGADPPRVHVAARRGPREWVFSVRDNGRGLDPAEAEPVFAIFKRLHPEIPGSGIGLAICRKIVERHGGRIWVESEPGRGANFLFTLPATLPLLQELPGVKFP